ncbi:MAG TPA: tRNA pseudouridine(55) synthase TruB [Candidatus Eisenbacteria bacterium]|nr:tRNA pseudouridine(55) synthase TruB [Candidatus Eisenbacteria bacterium]
MRTLLGERRVGHAGTLDPFASGLLLVGEGRATGILGCLGLLPKRYHARALLGVTTDTQDRTGKVLRRSSDIPRREDVAHALDSFRGPLRQRPPLYSAVKVRGERLYEAARRGVEVEREHRPIQVYALELIHADPPEVVLDATVSRGTYVRTLAHDLGETLGCGAHLTALRRTASGPFTVDQALSCDRDRKLGREAFRERSLAPEEALAFLPRVRLTEDEASRLRHGQAPLFDPARVEATGAAWPLPPGAAGWPLALLGMDGALLGIAHASEEQTPGLTTRLLRVLAEA